MKKIYSCIIYAMQTRDAAMRRMTCSLVRSGIVAILLVSSVAGHAADFKLAEGWTLQSSEKISAKGEVISTPLFKPAGWYPITVPATVIAGLLQNNVYPDPFFGENLERINKRDFVPSRWYR